MTKEHDFEVNDEGTIVQIIPVSQTAKDWIDENVESEGWQWLGRALCIDHRYAEDIIDGMLSEGLEMGA